MKFKIEPQPYRPGASFLTLLEKEILRFKKIALQTIFAPVLMGLLYLLVFGQVLAGKMPTFDGVNYLHFLVPGLVMMTMLQNAFGNSSSSMLSSKIMGSLIFIQLPPFAGWELSLAMIGASIVRALIVGAAKPHDLLRVLRPCVWSLLCNANVRPHRVLRTRASHGFGSGSRAVFLWSPQSRYAKTDNRWVSVLRCNRRIL